MAKEIRKTIRFSEIEYKKISEKIEKAEIDFSTFARSAILRKKIKMPVEKKVLYEINRIGNNLNQIAKYVNTKKVIDKIVLKKLIEIEKQVKELK